jgi:uncharacterized protein
MQQRQINRREMLRNSALLAGGLALSPFIGRGLAAEEGGTRKKVLFFTKSSGFQHSVITRSSKEPQKLAYAEQILTDIGARNGFDVTCSKDGTIFTPENLKQYDVIAFYTTLDLTKDSAQPGYKVDARGRHVADKQTPPQKEPGMGEAGKQAFLDAIKQGKGFVGFHSAADTFHSKGYEGHKGNLLRDVDAQGHDEFDPYIQMLGGEFSIHGAQQDAILHTIDPKFPGAEAFNGAKFVEEWYSLKNFAPDLHVILAQECTGMKGPMYQRGMYPETWARRHGQGPVFYTSMGHREDVWTRPDFQALVIGALNWTSGRIKVDITPNIQQATPEANVKG